MEDSFEKAIIFLKKNDPVLKKIIKKCGPCTLKPNDNYFESLVQSIMYQQLSLKAAGTIYKRFIEKVKVLLPKNVLKLTDEDFQSCGVSRQKRRYVRDLSEKFISKEINIEKIKHLDDETLIELLVRVKGIGRWTAEMFLMFSLNRLNVLPVDDIGFQRAILVNYKLRKKPSKEKILLISKKWGNYRTIATWYLWKSLEGNTTGWD
jgi:DNA-3-methyladenine glycosylase II